MPRYIKDEKYFECVVVGETLIRGTGTIGKKPRTSTKDFDDEEAANKAMEKLVAKQQKAGFVFVHDGIEALSEVALDEAYRDLALLERLVAGGVDLTFSDSDGWTLLHDACFTRDLDITRVLVRGGAPTDAALRRDHQHPYGTARKGVTPLQLAQAHLREVEHLPPDAPEVVEILTVVDQMIGASGDSEHSGEGAPAEPKGPGFDEDTYGAVVFGQRVEGLTRAAIAEAMTRATEAVGVFAGGDLGNTRSVADEQEDAGVPLCVGKCLTFACADDGAPAPLEVPATLDAAALPPQIETILAGVCAAPDSPAQLWLVAGGPLASAKLVVGERVPGRSGDDVHTGTTMTQERHADGVRGRVLAETEDVDTLPETPLAEGAYLVVRYD